nr:hypothetical protein [Tanacetum cinerariifolium]
MALTFADTHNMIAYLSKSDVSEGFDQIINFLNASVIQYALTVNTNIYVSCIKQFWSFVSVKKVNDVMRLQALIDRKKVIITEDTVLKALRLNDAKSIDCLSNEEIFTELARMGAKRIAWNEFSSFMASAIICLATAADDVDDVVPHAATEPTQPSPTPTTTPPPPQDLPSTSQVVPTPSSSLIAQPSSPPQQQQPSQPTTISMDLLHTLLETCTTLTRRVKNLNQDKIAQALEITKLKQKVRKLEKKRKLRVSGLKRLRKVGTAQRVESSEVDASKDAEVEKNADVQGRLKESQAQVDHIDLEHADKVLKVVTAATTTITAAPSAARRRKGVVIRDPEETATPSTTLEEEESKALKRKTKSFEEKVVKKQKLDEEVEELKKHLQIVPNDDDDVYMEATPLALKVPIVDYEIHSENNKPYYKIIRADGSHQLFLSFLSLLRNFDREDLEVLWEIVKKRFASSDPKNFSDDFLLTTLKAMFKKHDIEA